MPRAGNKQPKRQKHIPLRTCISCRQTKSKRELLRVVRTPDGHVVLDPTGKKSGRGAYLCAQLSCWQKATKKGRRPKADSELASIEGLDLSLLEQEFDLLLPEEDRVALESFIATLPKDEAVPAEKVSAGRRKAADK